MKLVCGSDIRVLNPRLSCSDLASEHMYQGSNTAMSNGWIPYKWDKVMHLLCVIIRAILLMHIAIQILFIMI